MLLLQTLPCVILELVLVGQIIIVMCNIIAETRMNNSLFIRYIKTAVPSQHTDPAEFSELLCINEKNEGIYNKENEMQSESAKVEFARELKKFASTLGMFIAKDGEWTVRGFIDIFKNIHTISADTKVVSKVLELHLFPYFLSFAESIGYEIELATYQNWYPDLTFKSISNPSIKFAVDLKTTYRTEEYPGFCNGFTLGSHGEYFTERTSTKNIQYPYDEYCGHFVVGIIYSKAELNTDAETRVYQIDEIENIPAVINNFLFFAEEKWKIASDKSGSGNTANIGSIQKVDDLLSGNGVFAKAGEALFDDYWANFGKMEILVNRKRKKLSSFEEYLRYRGLPMTLYNPKAAKRKAI